MCIIASINRYTICIRLYRICLFILLEFLFRIVIRCDVGGGGDGDGGCQCKNDPNIFAKWKRAQETARADTECVSNSM